MVMADLGQTDVSIRGYSDRTARPLLATSLQAKSFLFVSYYRAIIAPLKDRRTLER